MTTEERGGAEAIAGEAARRLHVAFPVIDIAQTAEGRWVVIEANDGQDAGYAGVIPSLMWRKVIAHERERAER